MARKTELEVQTAVRLPRDVYDRLKQSEHGVSEEIRRRLAHSFALDADPPTSKLMAAIGRLAVLVRLQTNNDWHSHPGAHWVLRQAILSRLARSWSAAEWPVLQFGELPAFQPGELPNARLVPTDNPQEMGLGLEVIDFHTPSIDEQQQKNGEKS